MRNTVCRNRIIQRADQCFLANQCRKILGAVFTSENAIRHSVFLIAQVDGVNIQ